MDSQSPSSSPASSSSSLTMILSSIGVVVSSYAFSILSDHSQWETSPFAQILQNNQTAEVFPFIFLPNYLNSLSFLSIQTLNAIFSLVFLLLILAMWSIGIAGTVAWGLIYFFVTLWLNSASSWEILITEIVVFMLIHFSLVSTRNFSRSINTGKILFFDWIVTLFGVPISGLIEVLRLTEREIFYPFLAYFLGANLLGLFYARVVTFFCAIWTIPTTNEEANNIYEFVNLIRIPRDRWTKMHFFPLTICLWAILFRLWNNFVYLPIYMENGSFIPFTFLIGLFSTLIIEISTLAQGPKGALTRQELEKVRDSVN